MIRLVLAAALLFSSAHAVGADGRISSFVGDDCRRYVYDLKQSTIETDRFQEIMELVGPVWTLRSHWTSHVQLCIEGDPAYAPCGSRTPSAANFWHNAAVNQAKGEKLVSRIAKLPRSLDPLSNYFSFRYRLWIEIGARKLEYLRLRDPALLTAPMMNLEVAAACTREAAALAELEADDDTVLASFKPWHNCVNHLLHDSPTQAAGYPVEAWQAFLEAEGIEEKIEPVAGCEQED